MAEKKIIQHKDILETPINVGNYVASASGNRLVIGKVVKLTPKQLKIVDLDDHNAENGYYKYSHDTVVVSGPEALVFVLKNS